MTLAGSGDVFRALAWRKAIGPKPLVLKHALTFDAF